MGCKSVLHNFTLVVVSIFFAIIIIEISLRVIPIKGIQMGTSVYDPKIKLLKHNPNSKFMRTNIRNERIIRLVNSEGFMDINHIKRKSEKTYRIGFFGDSYVEAIQVSLEKTFFRIIEDSLSQMRIETFGFGKSGHGSFHSYLINNYYSMFYDLDMIVYVFVENDLGDQIEIIKNSSTLPYLQIKDDELIINDRLLNDRINSRSIRQRILSSAVYSNSIFLQTLYRRIKMLKDYGIKTKAKENDFTLSSKGDFKKIPNQNDLPSTWNSKYKIEAINLGEAIINKWYNESKLDKKEFAIFYVPRSSQWKKNNRDQDSWKLWLFSYCEKLGISFIDPTRIFLKYDKSGEKIYDDHFSEIGHKAFAESFIEWYREYTLE